MSDTRRRYHATNTKKNPQTPLKKERKEGPEIQGGKGNGA